jgi:hypothetical protein
LKKAKQGRRRDDESCARLFEKWPTISAKSNPSTEFSVSFSNNLRAPLDSAILVPPTSPTFSLQPHAHSSYNVTRSTVYSLLHSTHWGIRFWHPRAEADSGPPWRAQLRLNFWFKLARACLGLLRGLLGSKGGGETLVVRLS